MRFNRFIGDFDLFGERKLKIENNNLLEQIRKVLRFKVGDKIILADGKLNEVICRIEKYGKDFIEVLIEKIYKNENESKNKVILYCAVLKKENFEWVAQKATEVGVSEIQPIITERTVKQKLNLDRLRKIIREAVEQSGRGLMPVLHEPIIFKMAIETNLTRPCLVSYNFFFDVSGKPHQSVIAIRQLAEKQSHDNSKNINIFVGPEGGWTEKEIELARNTGFKIASLGKLTLRAETAAIIASYLVTSY